MLVVVIDLNFINLKQKFSVHKKQIPQFSWLLLKHFNLRLLLKIFDWKNKNHNKNIDHTCFFVSFFFIENMELVPDEYSSSNTAAVRPTPITSSALNNTVLVTAKDLKEQQSSSWNSTDIAQTTASMKIFTSVMLHAWRQRRADVHRLKLVVERLQKSVSIVVVRRVTYSRWPPPAYSLCRQRTSCTCATRWYAWSSDAARSCSWSWRSLR